MPIRSIYVISDLHLGGEPEPGRRGFRICTREDQVAAFIRQLSKGGNSTELVINGDMVDFLAERAIDEPHGWKPFHYPEDHAIQLLDRIATRSAVIFEALREHLRKGNRLVILPGNHDIELNLPRVRARLRELVGAAGPADYEFIPHGEAYRVGDVLIEHGNRVDEMNFVDQNRLRILCGLLSRGEPIPTEFEFDPPPGSKMVAEVINDIKTTYSFIDLLKPEKEAAFPVILALEPGRRSELLKVARALASGKAGGLQQKINHRVNISAAPAVSAAIEPSDSMDPAEALDPLEASLLRTVGRAEFGIREPKHGTIEIAAFESLRGFAALLTGSKDETWEQRLKDLLDALRAFQSTDAFDRSVETDVVYQKEAVRLAWGPVRHVVFGHTHLAKKIELANGCYYFNSGTWADILALPKGILDRTREYGPLAELETLMKDLVSQNFQGYDIFHPTFVHFEQDAAGVSIAAELCDFAVEPASA